MNYSVARAGLQLEAWARQAGRLALGGCAAVSAWASPPSVVPTAAPSAVFSSAGHQAESGGVAQPLYRCPGPLFTNDLPALQARAMGCTLAQRAGWSQAQVPAEQALAQPQAHNDSAAATAVTANDTARSAALTLAATTLPAPVPSAARAMAPSEPGSEALRQRQRDRHARDIVLAELANTQARIQVLAARPLTSADQESALQRLRRDEDALRRELARRPG